MLEHTQDLVSIVVGVLLAGLAVVVLVLGVVDFFRDVASGSPVETAVINLLNRVLLVLILVEIMHTSCCRCAPTIWSPSRCSPSA